MKKRRVLISMIFAMFLMQNINAQLEEFQSKFIVSFAHFINWPALENQLSFKIGVLGKNHPILAKISEKTAGKSISGKPIEVVEFDTVEELSACHILFVPNSRLGSIRRVSKMFLGVAVLIVTESQEGMPSESLINIYVEDDKLGYKINKEKAESCGLVISSQIFTNSR